MFLDVIEEKYQLPDFSKLNENTEAEAVFVKPVNALSEIENEVLKQQVSENEIKVISHVKLDERNDFTKWITSKKLGFNE